MSPPRSLHIVRANINGIPSPLEWIPVCEYAGPFGLKSSSGLDRTQFRVVRAAGGRRLVSAFSGLDPWDWTLVWSQAKAANLIGHDPFYLSVVIPPEADRVEIVPMLEEREFERFGFLEAPNGSCLVYWRIITIGDLNSMTVPERSFYEGLEKKVRPVQMPDVGRNL